MRNPITVTAAAVAICLSAPGMAQTLPEITVLGKVQAPARYYMTPAEVHEVSGSYAMSDGSELTIKDRSRKLHFEIDGRKVELYPVANHVYSTSSRDVTLSWMPDGSASVVAIVYVPTAALAQTNPPRIRVGAFAVR